ncbi:hypothetical protein G7092_00650 [Mucilaginibacter sp. HC2]|uniref:TylF/MycF/NovP-related O-methyltransferase n=1 Tax=Mucilaginibacter inviolabilis TaxID=2714892 RepID=UPI0014091BB2|nr:TylF/MycF/NovP-related O-methyltransferase [Mucilaginibacter inviolabilis]NHA02279.1 hypothetical protein [Mucilaginibacter inviolabilis]
MNDSIIDSLKLSVKFTEGYNEVKTGCLCDKCKVSRYRHTHEPNLADPEHSYWAYLTYCINRVAIPGLWLEFGVGSGKSLSFIARQKPDQTIYGFDSFKGLPEDWVLSAERIYTKNTYSRNGIAPELVAENTELVIGLFSETLDSFCTNHTENCAFIHIDCDLYSSTMDVLDGLFKAGKIIPGTVILFDELYNYPNYKDYEYRALEDFIQATGLSYNWIAHTESPVEWNGNQAALVIV